MRPGKTRNMASKGTPSLVTANASGYRALLALPLLLLGLASPAFATELEDEELSQEIERQAPAPISHSDNDAEDPQPAGPQPLVLLDAEVPVNAFDTLYWSPDQSFRSIATPVPVLVAHGKQEGPALCLTAAVHGDELNGIEMVRRLMFQLETESLAGTVIGVPIVNIEGFRSGSRYLSDRRDLNRFFPGNPSGSSASRIAYSLFNSIIRHCDYLVDLHTGSQKRVNQPQLRADLKNSQVLEFAKQFGGITVLHSPGVSGMLRDAAVKENIIAVTMEAGGPNRLEEDAVRYGVQALETLMQNLNMRKTSRFWSAPQPLFYDSAWVRAEQGGILLSEVELNDQVRKGQILGTVTDPISNTGSAIIAPYNGRILGMAVNQVVHAGFAVYRIGEEKSTQELEERAEKITDPELAPQLIDPDSLQQPAGNSQEDPDSDPELE